MTSTIAPLPTRLAQWLETAAQREASDLHLATGHPACLRVHGKIAPLEETIVPADELREALLGVPVEGIADEFREGGNVDFAIEHLAHGRVYRFRANYFMATDGIGACFRLIPNEIPTFEWTGFPEELAVRLANLRNGLVLLSGMTGSGKTTTLAMIVDLINRQGGKRIVTIEDPIEYRYTRKSTSIVTQRETGRDVASFAEGLRNALRQDPDVILVGEIRDHETAQMALSAAETGHLVLTTLHTRDAKGAISRFTDLFPQSHQSEVRSQLAMCLQSVVCQHLLDSAYRQQRELALEILFASNAISSGIRSGKLETIDTGITTGRAEGMVTLDESLRRLVEENSITEETALRYASSPDAISRLRPT